ncbi:hypothetical protein HKX48_004170 [Thoreauomyces humboldtii]|nr:hypothetical protein HKX48_004170 [Thoreauomyces humboldtii]
MYGALSLVHTIPQQQQQQQPTNQPTNQPTKNPQPPLISNLAMIFTVTVVSVNGVKDGDVIGKGDIYVRLSTDKKTWQDTTVKSGAGTEALYDERFQFDVTPEPQSKLYVEVYDKDAGKDDLLGSNHVDLGPIGSDDTVALKLHKHVVHRHEGIVNLKLGFQ